jgi:hypothetical protein
VARLIDFWPEKGALKQFIEIFLVQDFHQWEDEEEELELPFGIFCILFEKVQERFE